MTDDNYPEEGYELDQKLSGVAELIGVNNFLKDSDVLQTLEYVVKLIAKPEIPADKAIPLITKLQALSFQFKMQGKYYMFIGKAKGEDYHNEKKNYFLSLAEETEKLVQALKYTTRNY